MTEPYHLDILVWQKSRKKNFVDHSYFAQGLTPLCQRLSLKPVFIWSRCCFSTLISDRIVVCRSQESVYFHELDFFPSPRSPTYNLKSQQFSSRKGCNKWFFWHLKNGIARVCQLPFEILWSDSSMLGHLVLCLPSWHNLVQNMQNMQNMQNLQNIEGYMIMLVLPRQDGSGYQNEWIFGKLPKGARGGSFSIQKFMLQILDP